MRYVRNRKYPITYQKSNPKERIIDLSITAAAGVIAFVFIQGALIGYMLKKCKDD